MNTVGRLALGVSGIILKTQREKAPMTAEEYMKMTWNVPQQDETAAETDASMWRSFGQPWPLEQYGEPINAMLPVERGHRRARFSDGTSLHEGLIWCIGGRIYDSRLPEDKSTDARRYVTKDDEDSALLMLHTLTEPPVRKKVEPASNPTAAIVVRQRMGDSFALWLGAIGAILVALIAVAPTLERYVSQWRAHREQVPIMASEIAFGNVSMEHFLEGSNNAFALGYSDGVEAGLNLARHRSETITNNNGAYWTPASPLRFTGSTFTNGSIIIYGGSATNMMIRKIEDIRFKGPQ